MLDQVVSLGWGVLSFSREKLEKSVEKMIKKGELSRENSKIIVGNFIERGAKERAVFKEDMNRIILKLLQKGVFATRNELTNLEDRIAKIEVSFNKNNNEVSERY